MMTIVKYLRFIKAVKEKFNLISPKTEIDWEKQEITFSVNIPGINSLVFPIKTFIKLYGEE